MTNIYNGSLTRDGFMFYEMRITAKLIYDGLSRPEIEERIKTENLFQFPTERAVKLVLNSCFRRIDALGSDNLVNLLANAPAETAKQINLFSMMKYYRLIGEFMLTVVSEKFRTQEFELTKKDLNLFFYRLQEQHEQAAAWSDTTVKKLKSVIIRSLVECGYLDSYKSEVLNAVLIEPELEDELRLTGELTFLPAFNCFR